MSGYKKHMFGGFFFMLLLLHFGYHYLNTPTVTEIFWYFVIAIMFALWPDIDIKSKGQKLFYTLFLITDIYLIANQDYKISAFFGLFLILPILSKHRGWTHSYYAMFLIPLPILLYPMISSGAITFIGFPYYLSALTGYFSHIVLDGKL